MAAEVTSPVEYIVTPNIHMKAAIFTYTKAATTDYLTVTSYGIKTVRWASCRLIAGTGSTPGLDDPCTWATSVVTMSVGTGTAAALVIGSG